MAQYTYEGRMEGSQVGQPFNGYWEFRYVLDFTKTGNTTWDWTLQSYIRLGSYSSKVFKAQNTRSETDTKCSFLSFGLTGLYDSGPIYKPYGPISSDNPNWVYYNTISGSCNIAGRFTTTAYGQVEMGWGSSLGTGTGSFGAYTGNIVTLELVGIVNPTVTDPWMTANTTSSLSTKYDIDWGYEQEGSGRKPYTRLYSSSGTLLQTLSGNEVTFTGLNRYTPYYVEAYTQNSVGSDTSNRVLMYTRPENPTIAKPTISNSTVSTGIQGIASVTITPGVVTDNGGKAITQTETFITGGEYGTSLTSIGTGSTNKVLSTLRPNTTYSVVTRATNGITESASAYTTFTTLGNPPELTDLYASNLSLTKATINYSAKYEYNASLKEYKVQWRYPGSTTWNTLTTSTNVITTNFDSLNENRVEYRITVTDNWNRSVTSNILNYIVLYDYSNDVTNLKYTENSDGSYTVSGSWTKRLYNKLSPCLLLSTEGSQYVEEITTSSSIIDTMNESGFTAKTKVFKNKRLPKTISLYLRAAKSSNLIVKSLDIPGTAYPKAINTINSLGSSVQREFSTITKNSNGNTVRKILRQHDIVKLSKSMRYIDIDSRGTFSSTSISNTITLRPGKLVIQLTYTLKHISGVLYLLDFQDIKIKSSDNSSLRLRNNCLSLLVNDNSSDNLNFRVSLPLPNITVTGSLQSIDCSGFGTYITQQDIINTPIILNIKVNWYPEYDSQSLVTDTVSYSGNINYGNSDIANNHLVNIKVYDSDGVDRAAGKTITLSDGSPALIYNNGNPTSNIMDSNKFIYSKNGLPLRLDLGSEYNISKIVIQRRILTKNTYFRNYIIGRNNNKELCYIFFDSNATGMYEEENKTFTIN